MLSAFSRADEDDNSNGRDSQSSRARVLADLSDEADTAVANPNGAGAIGPTLEAFQDKDGHVSVTSVLLHQGVVHPSNTFGRNYEPVLPPEDCETEAVEADTAITPPLANEEAEDDDWQSRCMRGQSCKLPFPAIVPKGTFENATTILSLVPDASTLSEVIKGVKDLDAFAPIKLHMRKAAFENHFSTVDFIPGRYHLLPLQVDVVRYDTRGIPIPLAIKVCTTTPQGERTEWGCANVLSSTPGSSGYVLLANHASQERSTYPLYRANPRVVEAEEFMRWMTQDIEGMRKYLATRRRGNYYLIPMPDKSSRAFNTPLQHMIACEFKQWLSNLEQDELSRYADFDEHSMFVTPSNAPFCAQVPTVLLDRHLAKLQQQVNAPRNLMCLDNGITVEVRPASSKGWADLQTHFIDRRASYPVTVKDPEVSLLVEIELTMVFNASLPRQMGHLQRIPVGDYVVSSHV